MSGQVPVIVHRLKVEQSGAAWSRALKAFTKNVFLTDATGYLGSLFLAKLMRLGNVEKVLILSRHKNGKIQSRKIKFNLERFSISRNVDLRRKLCEQIENR